MHGRLLQQNRPEGDQHSFTRACHAAWNRMRLCGVGGNDFAIILANPAVLPMSSNSRAVYASPCGVDPSIWNANIAEKRGDARSSFSKNSTATARPPEMRLYEPFEGGLHSHLDQVDEGSWPVSPNRTRCPNQYRTHSPLTCGSASTRPQRRRSRGQLKGRTASRVP